MIHAFTDLFKRTIPTWLYLRLRAQWNIEGVKKYSSNTLWLLMVRIASTLIAFFVSIYITRYLGPENYGQLSYAVSFVSLFSIIGSLGIDSVLYRDLIQRPEERNVYLGSAFILKISAGLLASISVITCSLFVVTDDVSRILILILASTFIFNAFNVITYEFQANVAQKHLAISSLLVVLILNILKLGVIMTGEGVIYLSIILLLETIFYALAFIYIRTRHYGTLLSWRFDSSTAISILKDSWPFIFIAVFASVYSRIDQVMLKHLIDSSAVGLYDAAVRVAEAWLFVPGIIVSSLFPAIINGKKTSAVEYKKRLISLLVLLTTVATLIALIFSLFAEPLMILLYGRPFLQSATAFSVYIWSGVFVSIGTVLHYFLTAENKRMIIFATSFGTMVLNVGLNFLLIPIMGITGAAWATLISYIVLTIPLFLILKIK